MFQKRSVLDILNSSSKLVETFAQSLKTTCDEFLKNCKKNKAWVFSKAFFTYVSISRSPAFLEHFLNMFQYPWKKDLERLKETMAELIFIKTLH